MEHESRLPPVGRTFAGARRPKFGKGQASARLRGYTNGPRAGDGTLVVYESVGAGQSRATVAAFRVGDIEATVAALRGRGVVFEEYDTPELKMENGIGTIGDLRAAWAKDPDGNIIAIESRTR